VIEAGCGRKVIHSRVFLPSLIRSMLVEVSERPLDPIAITRGELVC
jgi:hypothetical protein